MNNDSQNRPVTAQSADTPPAPVSTSPAPVLADEAPHSAICTLLASPALAANGDPAQFALATASSSPVPASGAETPASAICTVPSSSPPAERRKIRRNGRIACLPKVQRDMVNHMLWNGVPYKNIVAALDEAGYTVTERNISNWATGGHLEWSLVQEYVGQNRLDQDHMLDFLRREDAPELPEVGLQAAATRLSQVLLQKLARGEDPEAHLENYTKLVDLLVRINREIGAIQKQRDDSRHTLGPEYDPVRVQDVEKVDALENERFFSNPPSDSKLPRPAERPAVPPVPTATFLAWQAREKREAEEREQRERQLKFLKGLASATPSPAK